MCECRRVRTYIVKFGSTWFANCIDYGVSAKADSLGSVLKVLGDEVRRRKEAISRWAPEKMTDSLGVSAQWVEATDVLSFGGESKKLILDSGYSNFLTPLHLRRPRILLDSAPAWQVFKYNLIGFLANTGLLKAQVFQDDF